MINQNFSQKTFLNRLVLGEINTFENSPTKISMLFHQLAFLNYLSISH